MTNLLSKSLKSLRLNLEMHIEEYAAQVEAHNNEMAHLCYSAHMQKVKKEVWEGWRRYARRTRRKRQKKTRGLLKEYFHKWAFNTRLMQE